MPAEPRLQLLSPVLAEEHDRILHARREKHSDEAPNLPHAALSEEQAHKTRVTHRAGSEASAGGYRAEVPGLAHKENGLEVVREEAQHLQPPRSSNAPHVPETESPQILHNNDAFLLLQQNRTGVRVRQSHAAFDCSQKGVERTRKVWEESMR